jgi:hypothetical protein
MSIAYTGPHKKRFITLNALHLRLRAMGQRGLKS